MSMFCSRLLAPKYSAGTVDTIISAAKDLILKAEEKEKAS
jgi:hypothetical protein